MPLSHTMVTDCIEYKDVESTKELLKSPGEVSPSLTGEASCGLSTTTSESSSQPNSWSSRHDSPNCKAPGALSSYMPIVDEDDCPGPDSQDGHTSSEDETPVSPSSAIAAFHKAAYDRQVRHWQQVEGRYMRHEGWCEQRVIILLQEACRCSYQNLKKAHEDGTLSDDVYAARVAELRASLSTIKKEYRRTLERTHERRGDVAGIASKAVTCVASVYPWSSAGFVLGFEENLRYGELASSSGGGSARRGPTKLPAGGNCARSVVVVPATPPLTPAVPMLALEADGDEGEDSGIAESVVAGGRARRVATPRVTLQPLPPRRQLFQRGSLLSSPALTPTAATTTSTPTAVVPVCAALSEAVTRGVVAASPPPTDSRSPVPIPSAATAGPLRPGDARFLEKRQLVVHGLAFVSHSLASTTFIACRRATIAAATMRQRLGLVSDTLKTAVAAAAAPVVAAAPAVVAEEEGVRLPSSPSSFTTRRAMRHAAAPSATVSTLPTRYIVDVSPTPSEATTAFDSNPNSVTQRSNPGSVTQRSNPGSVTKRPVLANPTSYAAPTNCGGALTSMGAPTTTIAATCGFPGSVTKRSMNALSSNGSFSTLPHSTKNAMGNFPVRDQPHSYSTRMNSVPATVAPSQPHSYTARSVHVPMTPLSHSAMPTPMYVPAPCAAYHVDPQERGAVPAGLPVYCPAGVPPPPPSGDHVVAYAVPTGPPPPPAYTSHIRRDRLCAPAAPFNAGYAPRLPVSVADDQYVKEMW